MSDENNNLNSGEECQSCLYERVLCLQEGACILEKIRNAKTRFWWRDEEVKR